MNPFNIYCSGHQHSRAVCDALARGTGLPVVDAAPLRAGGVATYGFLRGLLPTLREAQAAGRAWVYADRGYFGATYGSDYSGYFRVTAGAYQFVGPGEPAPARLRRLRLHLRPWRVRGEHVVVCPPGDTYSLAVGGFGAAEWLAGTLAALRAATDRQILVRHKSERDARPLEADLVNAHALVTYMSNTAVEAAVLGVPVFCSERCAAAPVGRTELSEIEDPATPDREAWAATLAANQWTLDELARGDANHLFR